MSQQQNVTIFVPFEVGGLEGVLNDPGCIKDAVRRRVS